MTHVCVCVCVCMCVGGCVGECVSAHAHSVVSNTSDPMDCSPPVSSVHGVSQVKILEWVAISYSRESSRSKNLTHISCLAGRFFYHWATKNGDTLYSQFKKNQEVMKLWLLIPLLSSQAFRSNYSNDFKLINKRKSLRNWLNTVFCHINALTIWARWFSIPLAMKTKPTITLRE